jgi:hypothetical protein
MGAPRSAFHIITHYLLVIIRWTASHDGGQRATLELGLLPATARIVHSPPGGSCGGDMAVRGPQGGFSPNMRFLAADQATRLLVASLLSAAVGGDPAAAFDFSTPEGAAAAFLDAEKRNDIDGLATAQDFRFEAREALGLTAEPLAAEDAARVERKATDLETTFRERLGQLPPRNLYRALANTSPRCESPSRA